jgi:hypothetical protein
MPVDVTDLEPGTVHDRKLVIVRLLLREAEHSLEQLWQQLNGDTLDREELQKTLDEANRMMFMALDEIDEIEALTRLHGWH